MVSSYKKLVRELKIHKRLHDHLFSYTINFNIAGTYKVITCKEKICSFSFFFDPEQIKRSCATSKDPRLKIFNTTDGPSILVRSFNHNHDIIDYKLCELCKIEEIMDK